MEEAVLRERLERCLKPKRYRHSLGVAAAAEALAARFGAPVRQAYLAGLLHDCAREIPVAEMTEAAGRLDLAVSPLERFAPILLHARLGAVLAETKYGIADPAVLRAIRLHTVGGSAMTDLDKIVYLADMIEPGRDFPGVEALRALAEEELNRALLAAFDQSLAFVLQKRQIVHPDTVTARNALLLGGAS